MYALNPLSRPDAECKPQCFSRALGHLQTFLAVWGAAEMESHVMAERISAGGLALDPKLRTVCRFATNSESFLSHGVSYTVLTQQVGASP